MNKPVYRLPEGGAAYFHVPRQLLDIEPGPWLKAAIGDPVSQDPVGLLAQFCFRQYCFHASNITPWQILSTYCILNFSCHMQFLGTLDWAWLSPPLKKGDLRGFQEVILNPPLPSFSKGGLITSHFQWIINCGTDHQVVSHSRVWAGSLTEILREPPGVHLRLAMGGAINRSLPVLLECCYPART